MKRKNVARAYAIKPSKKLLITCAVLLLICAIYRIGPIVYFEPEVQRALDQWKPNIQFAPPQEKGAELIAFTCRMDIGYGNGVYTMKTDGSSLQRVNGSKSKFHYELDWSPDGVWLVMLLRDQGQWSLDRLWSYENAYSEVYLMRFDGSKSRRLTYDRKYNYQPLWAIDGASIFLFAGSPNNARLQRLTLDGLDTKQLTGLNVTGYDLAMDGSKLLVDENTGAGPSRIYQMNADGSGPELLLESEERLYRVRWSPDKERILYRSSDSQIHLYNVVTNEAEPLPTILTNKTAWSPNGRWIAILGSVDSYYESGKRISVTGNAEARSEERLYLFELKTGKLYLLVDEPVTPFSEIAWSPKSDWIVAALSSYEDQLVKIKRDGSGLQKLTDLDCRPEEIAWSPT